jgi:hypothetical protein
MYGVIVMSRVCVTRCEPKGTTYKRVYIAVLYIHVYIYELNIGFGGPNVRKKTKYNSSISVRGSTEAGLIREGLASPTSACHASVRPKGMFFVCLLRRTIQMFVTFYIPKEFSAFTLVLW